MADISISFFEYKKYDKYIEIELVMQKCRCLQNDTIQYIYYEWIPELSSFPMHIGKPETPWKLYWTDRKWEES